MVKGAYRAGWCRLSMAMEIGRRSGVDRGGDGDRGRGDVVRAS
ncbi:hypothetical protein [Bartonella massiliensis]|nr:hypothetical protein [Bartonella massiliensis]